MALELWIEAERDPVVVRLKGTLDGSTAGNLLAVVRELIDEGARDLELWTSALTVVAPHGVGALEELERLVQRNRGHVRRAFVSDEADTARRSASSSAAHVSDYE